MKNFIEQGHTINFTLAGTVAAGDPIVIGKFVGIAVNGGVSGDVIAVKLTGVYEVIKKGTDVLAAGDLVYWDTTPGEATSTASANFFMGHVFEAAGNGVLKVKVRLSQATA
jgi:predicted RecA/RadA family phage recombinase